MRGVVRAERDHLTRPALAVAQESRLHAEHLRDLSRAGRVIEVLDLVAVEDRHPGRAADDRRREVDDPGQWTPAADQGLAASSWACTAASAGGKPSIIESGIATLLYI